MNISNSDKYLKSGTIWTILNRSSVLLMQFSAMLILARLIRPEDFALMGISIFFITISEVFVDSGMGGALVVKKDIQKIDYSTFFIFNMCVSLLIFILLQFTSPIIASFFDYESLPLIISTIGFSIIISGFGKVQNVLLLRQLKYKEISIIYISSSFIALVIAIILAFFNYGVWALVFQNIINNLLIVLLQTFNNNYIPKLKFSLHSFKEQWAFGGNLLYSKLLGHVYQNIFLIIFPKISSLNFSGLYTQSDKIQKIPVNLVNSVFQSAAFPVMSKINNIKELKELSKSYSRKVYLVGFTILFALSVFSKEIILILLGDQWLEAKWILSILAIGAIGMLIYLMSRNVFKVLGDTKQIFKIEIIKVILGLLLIFVSYPFGDYIILTSIVITSFLIALYSIYKLSTKKEFVFKELIMDILIPLLIVLPSSVILFLLNYYIIYDSIFKFFIGFPLYLILVFITGKILNNKEMSQLVIQIRKIITKRS